MTMISETISYDNTHTIQELADRSFEAYSDRDILRYEREDVIYRGRHLSCHLW